MNRKEKAQSLVEFALIIVFFMALIVLFVDVSPLGFDLYASKQMSARGARAASIYLADGSRTCQQDVMDAIGDAWLIHATYTVTIVGPCTNDPSDTIITRTPITVRIAVDYFPPFIKTMFNPITENVLSFEVETTDQAR